MTINQFTTDGLIIKEQQIGERDKLITVLSRNYGVITAYASGAMTIKSKKGAATSMLAYASFTIKQKGDKYSIVEASPIQLFFKSGSDIEILSLAQYFCELCLNYAPTEENCEDILRLLLNTLHYLTQKKRNIFLLKAIFELRLMVLIGYMPNLVACHKCSTYENDLMYFDTIEGILFCKGCAEYKGEYAVINSTLITSMRHIVFSELQKLFAFTVPDEAAKALSLITERYLINKTENRLRTLDFFKSLF